MLDALEMALAQRRPVDVIHHSDQGCQYTSLAFGIRYRLGRRAPLVGGQRLRLRDVEGFFAILECELLDQRRFRPRPEASLEVFDYIEGFYNLRRRRSALGYLSPVNFERRMLAAA